MGAPPQGFQDGQLTPDRLKDALTQLGDPHCLLWVVRDTPRSSRKPCYPGSPPLGVPGTRSCIAPGRVLGGPGEGGYSI